MVETVVSGVRNPAPSNDPTTVSGVRIVRLYPDPQTFAGGIPPMIHYETKTEGTFTMIYNTGWRHHVATPESGAASMCPGTCSLTHFPKTQNMHNTEQHRPRGCPRATRSGTLGAVWERGLVAACRLAAQPCRLAAQPQGAHTGDELDF